MFSKTIGMFHREIDTGKARGSGKAPAISTHTSARKGNRSTMKLMSTFSAKQLFAALGITIMVGILGICGVPKATAQEEGWIITDFHSDIAIQESGVVRVVETIAVDFADLEKHGIYRDIPYIYTNEDGSETYTDVQVSSVVMDGSGATYDTSSSNGYIRIKIGDADKTISGKHTYTITYDATGVLVPFSDFDEFYWDVTGNGWGVPITKSSAIVSLPREGIIQISCYVGAYGDPGTCTEATSTKTKATFNHVNELESGEGLTVAVGYTKGLVPILTVAAPKEIDDILKESRLPIPVAAIMLIGGMYLLLRLWRKKGRDEGMDWRSEQIVVEYESPEKLRPGILGVLMDESADTLDVSATIVDLAVRGYLTITEIPKKGWFDSTDYKFKKTSSASEAALLPYERKLYSALFEGRDEVLVSDLKMKFHTDLAAVKEKLYEEVTDKKLFTGNPSSVRTKHGAFAVLGMFVAFGITFASLPPLLSDTLRALMIGIGPALGVLALIYFFVALKAMPQRSAYGRELYRKARGYKEFIDHVEKYRQRFFEKENTFMDVLPYAMIFGATKKLAEAMKTMGVVPQQPTWYHSSNAFNMATFSNSISSFSSSVSSAMASTPSSSGSSGGGSSGGGFGGGGGGSW